MASSSTSLALHGVLDPLGRDRVSIRFANNRVVELGTASTAGGRDVDGSSLWILPALYDADENTPFVDVGLRQSDRIAALAGGAATITVGIRWHEIRDVDLHAVAASAAVHRLPAVVPALSVSDRFSEGFPEWLRDHGDQVKELFAGVCKLYSMDPNFERNLDAVWRAGLLPLVFCADDAALSRVVELDGGPVHFRHATSAQEIDEMRRASDVSVQTSPHFLLPVPEGVRDRLFVMPAVPGEAVRESLVSVFVDAVDVVASDHNAPPVTGQPTAPGLYAAPSLLAALLTACDLYDWPLDVVLRKASSTPAERFGVSLGEAFVIVDPTEELAPHLWPRQGGDRAPFAETRLRGRVVCVAQDEHVVFV
jgi:dihydroorotase-like cyclic amidohydrolase